MTPNPKPRPIFTLGLGRFINRDPIEEAGGLNLYGFSGNDGVNGTDYLGMIKGDRDFWGELGGADGGGSSGGFGGWGGWGGWYDPWDDFGYFGGGGGGPYYEDRSGNVTAPAGALARSNREYIGSRGRAPTDARQSAPRSAGYDVGRDDVLLTGSLTSAPMSEKERILQQYRKYILYLLNPSSGRITFGTVEEANMAGALRAAVYGGAAYEPGGHNIPTGKIVDSFEKYEYVWGVRRVGDDQYLPTAATTNEMEGRAWLIDNPEVRAAKADGSLVAVGHNHPYDGDYRSFRMSGYGLNGSDVQGFDRGQSGAWKVPIYMNIEGFQDVGGPTTSEKDMPRTANPSSLKAQNHGDFDKIVEQVREMIKQQQKR